MTPTLQMPAMFATLGTRNRQPELMDQPGLDERQHGYALQSLSRINWISRTSAMIWKPIRKLAGESPGGRPVRILDVACGGGDVVVGLARRAARAGTVVQVDGCDINPVAVEHARHLAHLAGLKNVEFFQHDALHRPLPEGYDVVTCSLFLHHLENNDAQTMLRSMGAAAGRMVVASDLRRNRFAYAMTWIACRVLTRSPIVHVDGPLSVAAAFTVAEAQELAERAGLSGARFSRYFPERFLLVWRKPQ
ncbi:MAG TPA: methyltransferase domain-containing protein [Planctomycetaceae bacterium]|jgi:2-polyprenyl-3-methyl-5-hydroxy-6-metoxy-1,4-benzoquinol methylase